ncbi:glycosyl transferase [Mucilaginibacter terrenus]|uniref:Glycosyl transferase n=1 Tax=Mucilaginibacter terrenus TaxID=2482727 RepID=A0A3E2NXP5_9SPHI|nr:glycosyl transferase [Mucilaginibacter terrenus]RFZ85796.1 glycosyl transferase [Mucilaginibacter terrenus]
MRTAFTICANNYLAAAKVLRDSFNRHHPEIPFFIILADERTALITYDAFAKENIIFARDILELELDELSQKFSIAELCTTLKPFVFQYFFRSNDQVVYIDPDIKVYSPLIDCWEALNKYTFVLTPHLMSPVDDGCVPSDFYTLRTGIFNLGFIGLSKGEELPKFLTWWGERLLVYGYSDWDNGMFYDQIWANYIPVMFNNYLILKHPGYNVANWNWHERLLEKCENGWQVNKDYPLVFFHFSSYRYNNPKVLCAYNTRYNRVNRPDIAAVIDDYYISLKAAGADTVMNLPVYFNEQYQKHKLKVLARRPLKEKIKNRLNKIINSIF